MKRYIALSTFNAFFNLIFWGVILIQCFDGSYISLLNILLVVTLCSYPILRWYFAFSNKVIIDAHLSLFDGLIKCLLLLSVSFIFIVVHYKNQGQMIVDESTLKKVGSVLLLCVFVKFFYFLFMFNKKLNLANKLDVIHKNKKQDFSTYGGFLFNFDALRDYIKNYTNNEYYIIREKLPKDESNIEFKIYSNNKIILFNYIKESFVIDGCLIDEKDINHFQSEYSKKLFEMNDQELETIKMWSI